MNTMRLLLISTIALTSIAANAECTWQASQEKSVKTTNMMQVYNRQKITYMENDQTPPASFQSKFEGFLNRSNALSVQVGEFVDANPNIEMDTKIDQSICDGYDELFAKYVPAGYEAKEVSVKPVSADANCTSTGLWDKYGELIQTQTDLFQAGKFSEAEQADMMRLSTEIGVASTTDLTKACDLMDEFEERLNSK